MITNPISASNASHSSEQTASTTSASEVASLTIAMISARREGSTHRRGLASQSAEPCSAECDDHHGMVAVSLRSAHAPDLAVRVEARERRRRVPELPDQGPGLTVELLAVHGERALPTRTVEDQRRARGLSCKLLLRERDRVPGTDDDAVRLLVGELDGSVRRQGGGADEPAIVSPPEHVPQPDVARQLRLRQRVHDRHGFELPVL